jgi:hypothetical protein
MTTNPILGERIGDLPLVKKAQRVRGVNQLSE